MAFATLSLMPGLKPVTELYSTFVISQVVCDDVVPAELAHLHSEVVRYLGTSRNNRLSA